MLCFCDARFGVLYFLNSLKISFLRLFSQDDGVEYFNTVVVQPHRKLVTNQGRGFHIRCRYQTKEKTITNFFNVRSVGPSAIWAALFAHRQRAFDSVARRTVSRAGHRERRLASVVSQYIDKTKACMSLGCTAWLILLIYGRRTRRRVAYSHVCVECLKIFFLLFSVHDCKP